MKIYVDGSPVNREMLEKEFELTSDVSEADYVICWTRPPAGVDLSKTIILQGEPPIYTFPVYDAFHLFHTAITFNPKNENEFSFTDYPIAYPYNSYWENPVVRDDITIKNRKVFFAGLRNLKNESIERHNCKIVYELRSRIANHFLDKGNGIIRGQGWPESTKFTELGWQDQKFKDLEEHDPDFILCMENSMIPNYISEKIMDGFVSDRLVLYLGAPNVKDFVPEDCFIYLNDFYNEETDEFDFEKLDSIIDNMTQEEYDGYIKRAREFRESMGGRHQEEKDKLTKFIIERIKNEDNKQ